MFVDMGLDTQFSAASQIAVCNTGALANYGEFQMNPENTKTSTGTLETFRIISLVGDVTRVQFSYGDLQDQNKTIKFFDAGGNLITTQVLPLVGNGFSQPFDSGTFANGAKAAYWVISGGFRDLGAINSISVEIKDTVQTVASSARCCRPRRRSSRPRRSSATTAAPAPPRRN